MHRASANLVLTTSLLVSVTIGCGRPADDSNTMASDYVFTNGKVYTVDADDSWAEAVAVKGRDIVYVGDSAGAAAYVRADTESIDLGGKMLLPGFVDAHIHPAVNGVVMTGVDLQTDDIGEIFSRIGEYVNANPDLEVILGYGVRFNPWNNDWPSAAMIDEIESARPVFFWAIDGHAGWANSKALEMAGVTKDTPEPAPGFSYFDRDEEGNPTGWIFELPAQMMVLTSLIDIDADYKAAAIREWLPRFSAAGLTTMQDLGQGGLPEAEGYEVFAAMEEADELAIRVQGSYYWNNKDLDPIPELQRLQEKYGSELMSAVYLKINVDGGDATWNGLYVDGYADKPDLEVDPIIPYEVINDAVERADALGIDVTCHCFGDLAVRKMLDAIEMAIEVNPPRDRRHYISHATLVHPDDLARFGELGVGYDTTPVWMTLDPFVSEVTTERLGPDRTSSMFPVRAIHNAGGRVSFGSDLPAAGYYSEYRPLVGIQAAVLRQLPGREHISPLGGEAARLPLDVAIRAYTEGAAGNIGLDDKVGSIEVGKRGDLIILDQNLFDLELNEIGDTKVLYTMMNGRVTHRDGI